MTYKKTVPKVLILTSKTGGGHVSLAESLHDQLTQDFAVQIIDPQPRVIHWHYRLLSRHALWLWAAEFKFSNTPKRALSAHRLFTTLFARNISELLSKTRPNCIITTYPFLTYEVTRAMQQVDWRCPFVMLFTDPNGVHHSWLTENNATATFAPTQETYDQALRAGFAAERLHFTGWPVRDQFYRAAHAASRSETLTKLNLRPDMFTIFLQGGGEGAAKFAQTVENLLTLDNIQIILAAGTNQSLLKRFNDVENLYTLGFTKTIARYMAAADVIMGKAGPNMLFEALALSKPFIATTYIPGQEEVNWEFIERHQLGWVTLTAREQRELVQQLSSDPTRLQTMGQTVASYQQQNTRATQSILPLIHKVMRDYAELPN
jgi:processive 1,2-diacylglycerol beta-glucosyltransferase